MRGRSSFFGHCLILALLLPGLAYFYIAFRRTQKTLPPIEATLTLEQVALQPVVTSSALRKAAAPPKKKARKSENKVSSATILTYHRIATRPAAFTVLPPKKFAAQMDYLHRNGFNVVPLQKVIEAVRWRKKLPPRTVALTFDDGYRSCYTEVLPIIQRYQFPATMFVYTNYIDTNSAALTWSHVKDLAKTPLIDVQSHTLSHPSLPRRRHEARERFEQRIKPELITSKSVLQKQIGKRVTILAYPYGAYDSQGVALTKQAGYMAAVTVNEAPVRVPGSDLLRLPRHVINREDSLADFARKAGGEPLALRFHSPVEGAVSSTRRPLIVAAFAEEVEADSITMRLGRKKVAALYDRRKRILRYYPLQDLAFPCIVNIEAKTPLGRPKQAAWSFETQF